MLLWSFMGPYKTSVTCLTSPGIIPVNATYNNRNSTNNICLFTVIYFIIFKIIVFIYLFCFLGGVGGRQDILSGFLSVICTSSTQTGFVCINIQVLQDKA